MNLPSNDNLKELLNRATPEPWIYRRGGTMALLGKPDETYPDHIVHIDQDDKGQRRTSFVATCEATTLPNAANAELLALARPLAERVLADAALLAVAREALEPFAAQTIRIDSTNEQYGPLPDSAERLVTMSQLRRASQALEKLK